VIERFGFIKAALERKGRRIEDFDAAIAAHALTGTSRSCARGRKKLNHRATR
jgi:predicted nucleic acid-binding protein